MEKRRANDGEKKGGGLSIFVSSQRDMKQRTNRIEAEVNGSEANS